MQKYSVLLGYFDKQVILIERLYSEINHLDLSVYENRYVFALKTQQFYTAIEDLFKQIAKAFENNIDSLSAYHKELLIRLNTDIPKIRPAVISRDSLLLLDKIRAFRHFIRHAYDCELDQAELEGISKKLDQEFSKVLEDLKNFRSFVTKLADS